MDTCAFIQFERDRFLLLEGPLTFLSSSPKSEHSIYSPDFFLKSERPWITGKRAVTLTREEWQRRFPDPVQQGVIETGVCGPPNKRLFGEGFDQLQSLFKVGSLQKGVPVSFATGELYWRPSLIGHWLAVAGNLHSNLFAYGLFDGESGIIGAAPEILFESREEVLTTMALAGTHQSSPETLMESEKDRHEHELVKRFLCEALEPFGDLEVGETSVQDFGTLYHLHTPFAVGLQGTFNFEDYVRALHPTPALGVAPRNEAGWAWLQSLERGRCRGKFGAPFGARFPNGEAKCVVAIRNVQFNRETLEVWSGCGVVPDSRFEKEWNELCAKNRTVLEAWGIRQIF